jgi:hypothetical protein
MPQLAALKTGVIAGPQNAERGRTAASTRAVAGVAHDRTRAYGVFVRDDRARAAACGTFTRNFVVL